MEFPSIDDSAATLLSKLQMGQEIRRNLFQIVVNIYVSCLIWLRGMSGTGCFESDYFALSRNE